MHCHQCRGQESYLNDVRLAQVFEHMSIRGDSYGTASENETGGSISLYPNFFWRTFDKFDNPHLNIVTHLLEFAKAEETLDDFPGEDQKENKNDHRIATDSADSQANTCKAENKWSSPKPPTNHGSGVTDFVLSQKSLLHNQFSHGSGSMSDMGIYQQSSW